MKKLGKIYGIAYFQHKKRNIKEKMNIIIHII